MKAYTKVAEPPPYATYILSGNLLSANPYQYKNIVDSYGETIIVEDIPTYEVL